MKKGGIIAGKNSVEEALKAGRPLNKVFFARGIKRGTIQEIISLAEKQGIPYQFVAREKLDSLAEGNLHQGVLAWAGVKAYVEWEEMIGRAERKKEIPFLVILDGLEDPQNLGAILRTAEVVGVHGVIIPKHRAVGLTPAVSRASAGAVEYVPVARVANLPQVMDKLKERGFWLVGTEPLAERNYLEVDLKEPLALVLGSEAEGMRRLVKEKCDFLVKVPMRGKINSLNVSVTAALLFYEVIRQRGWL
ncbi:MAG TPA: 23S rRNA (guanosine(2251)-2'-O)-methyltransferase RlmB [Clostridia bacterium]|jgi:23S rRNA (guanosine2251-2'-O)-methyltransferase|nr:23S rRNA (guanosine(2251)-2'-O)-methyltransferase RlmB [Clostridia bacterium]